MGNYELSILSQWNIFNWAFVYEYKNFMEVCIKYFECISWSKIKNIDAEMAILGLWTADSMCVQKVYLVNMLLLLIANMCTVKSQI